jgi:hypothetical protein
MKKTKSSQNKIQLVQVGDRTTFNITLPGEMTTKYFEFMAKFAKLLLAVDIYLVSCLSLKKINICHLLHPDSNRDMLCIEERTNLQEAAGDQVRGYLRRGKELIMSSLESVSDRDGFDELLSELTLLAYETNKLLAKSLSIFESPTSTLAEIDLIRLLDELWLYCKGAGRKASISINSLNGNPRVGFKSEPPLLQWVTRIDDPITPGLFTLVAANFEDPRKWRARMFHGESGRSFEVTIIDPEFLENIQSSQNNVNFGLLIGDVLKTKFRSCYDPITSKTTYEIISVDQIIRADQFKDQEFDFS